MKGFSEDYVHYLPKRIKGGPDNGSAPERVAKIERSISLGVLYPEIEQQLLQVQLMHPIGKYDI